jgi:tetratricopeptide (TPR) repeat protein
MRHLFIFVVLMIASPVRASDAMHASAEAEHLFAQATEAFESGRYAEALEAYRHAWRLAPAFRTAVGVGQVELHLGMHRDAAEHLSYALRHFPAGGSATLKERIRAGLDEARAHVGVLRIDVDAEGAEIRVNGSPVGMAPLSEEVFVEPGRHRVSAEHAGRRAEASVDAVASRSTAVALVLAEPPTRDAEPGFAPATWALLGGGALTSVGIASAVVFSLNASAAGDDVRRARASLEDSASCVGPAPPAACEDLRRATEDRNTANRAATIAAVSAGVIGAGTAVVAAVLWPMGRSPRADVEVQASARGSFVTVSGSF